MSDNTHREQEISDILGQLRASVDKNEQSKKQQASSDVFDREIAALIEKQLSSRDASTANDEPKDSVAAEQEASPFYSDEIDLNDFVTDDQAEEETVEIDQTVEAGDVAQVVEELEAVDDSFNEDADAEDTSESESGEIPPAVFEALQAAFAVDNDDFVEQVTPIDDEEPIIEEILPMEEEELVVEEIMP